MAEMSETKTPKPGEWWLRNTGRGGRIFYISGFNPEGWVVHWNEDVGFFSSQMRFFCKEFHHEPRCTGFGWVEPPAIDPGEGYVPVAVPGIKRVPVRLWINEEDGWLFASPDQVLASDQEILHDADGFFVEPPAIDPNDIPLNPVPGKVVATGTVKLTPVTPTACVACGVNWALDGSVSCRECYEYAIEATGCPVESTDNMAAIIAEHTQQVRELTQRIGELARQVNQRDAWIEKIKTALHQGYSV